jgi:hypothetical protein
MSLPKISLIRKMSASTCRAGAVGLQRAAVVLELHAAAP